jgi:hypothetical protein
LRYGSITVWARVHKIDRVRPQPSGGAIVLVEDERSAALIGQNPPLSTLVAIARILNAHRALEMKFGGKGEVRYATNAKLPTFMFDAIRRAGAAVTDRSGDPVEVPAEPASVASIIDLAFAELASNVRLTVAASDMTAALRKVEDRRRKTTLDKDADPAAYWTAVLELAALAGELSRPRGGRWIDTREMPIPFALKFPEGALATPTKLAQQIVEGGQPIESMATEVT